MIQLHNDYQEVLEIRPKVWADVGLEGGDARRTALVGDASTVAQRMPKSAELGIDTFLLSSNSHLEEAYRMAELL